MSNIRIGEELTVSRKRFAESTIMLEGRPFSLRYFPMFHKIYNTEYPELLLKCGRQVGKTVTEHNLMLIESVAIPGFRHLYVSPSKEQTQRFSVSKLQKTLLGSKDLRSLLLGADHRCNVFHHLYDNGSEVFLSYAGDSADRIRGISADRIHYDEIQDIPYDGVVPVINECASKSEYQYITYAGTPKSKDNTIEFLWQISTQNEWAVKCKSCGSWNIYTNLHGLGRNGIVCLKCKKYVNPYHGRWVELNPGASINGFHIPQVILPENNALAWPDRETAEKALTRWHKIMRKLSSGEYSEATFLNEVMGVSTASGTRIMSLDQLMSMRGQHHNQRHPGPHWNKSNYRLIFAGIDWGGNGKEGVSRSVLTIFGLRYDGMLELLYYRIYPVENPLSSLEDMILMMRRYGVACVGADAGEGTLANPMLRREFGYENVYPIRYMAIKNVLEWDSVLHQGCYKADRTALIDNFAMFLKINDGKNLVYPAGEDAKPLFNDMLSIFEEVTRAGKKIWNRHPRIPDDGLHAQVFAWTAMKIRTEDLHWYTGE